MKRIILLVTLSLLCIVSVVPAIADGNAPCPHVPTVLERLRQQAVATGQQQRFDELYAEMLAACIERIKTTNWDFKYQNTAVWGVTKQYSCSDKDAVNLAANAVAASLHESGWDLEMNYRTPKDRPLFGIDLFINPSASLTQFVDYH
ncbi:MAG: hypothetical protein K2X29_14125 [Candidatus Obscuribacterales bacterium]|nr:hypothetical protein [Candidatus Obscuribacterales bacterium]